MCVQVGILGFAHGHVNSYCDEWRAHPELGVTVEAGWHYDGARLQRAVELLGLESYHDVDELLSNRKIQAVVIASETSRHADALWCEELIISDWVSGKMRIATVPYKIYDDIKLNAYLDAIRTLWETR